MSTAAGVGYWVVMVLYESGIPADGPACRQACGAVRRVLLVFDGFSVPGFGSVVSGEAGGGGEDVSFPFKAFFVAEVEKNSSLFSGCLEVVDGLCPVGGGEFVCYFEFKDEGIEADEVCTVFLLSCSPRW